CTGQPEPPMLPIPGIDHPAVHVLRNVADMDGIKEAVDDGAKSAVVIGGGYIGVEMAENLHERGLSVNLVEMADQVMTPLDPEMAAELQTHMRWHGIKLHLGVAAVAFGDENGKVRVELVSGDMLTADLVVLSAGVKPESSLAQETGLDIGARGGIKVNNNLQTSDPDIYAAGDAIEVTDAVTGEPGQIPLAGPANRQGRSVADHIYGRPGVFTNVKGTAIVKVFDMTGGGTGASEKVLKRSEVPYRKVYLHQSGHAGYYPGTAPMHLKVLFAPDTGKLLGAQAVGYDGVDKRLDVLATALCGGMTVMDLQELELAYAPPYGSAKDPVNMAGFVGTNILNGDHEVWYAEDYPDKTAEGTLVDVRTPQEYDIWHIPGAINIPVNELRQSLDKIPRDKTAFVYCKAGFRGYLAYRILKQEGFETTNLSGGTMTFCGYHDTGVCTGQPEPPMLSYAEEKTAVKPSDTGKSLDLDVCGLQCPGPIRKLTETMVGLVTGDEVVVKATDPGFASDVPAWCKSHGHHLENVSMEKGAIIAKVRKGAPGGVTTGTVTAGKDKMTMVVFSGDLDKALAAFIIAGGAASMGKAVIMFFTFWGLNALRKSGPQAANKPFIDRLFGMMMPSGPKAMKLSKMNIFGAGTTMMKQVMKDKGVDSLPELMAHAQKSGVKLVACAMSMDVMGLKQEELIDGVELGGVASFLGESDEAGTTLFI
ncbi:DsrE/DsrF/DrsH-like family protein, partial [Planctomycetota bacterium]